MELTLNQTVQNCYDIAFTQTLRKDEAADSVIPDSMPDVGEILSATGNILIRSKDVGEGRVRLEANVPVKVSYIPEEGEGYYAIEVNIPFYLSIEDEKISANSLCAADMKLLSLEAKLLNPRKINVRAEVLFSVVCYEPERQIYFGKPLQNTEGIYFLEQAAQTSHICAVSEKTFVITDEFSLPASISLADPVLSQKVQLQVDEIKNIGSKLVVKGNAKSSLLYCAEDGNPSSLEFTTVFSQIMDVDALPEEAFAAVNLLSSGIYYDLSGGNGQTGTMELHIVAQAVIRSSSEMKYLSDAYSNQYFIKVTTDVHPSQKILRPIVLKQTVKEQIPSISQVSELIQGSYVFGSAEFEAGTVSIPLDIWAYCQDSNGKLFMVARRIPIQFVLELPENQGLEITKINGQEFYLAPSTSGLELRLTVELNAILWSSETITYITGIAFDDNETMDLSSKPTLVIMKAGSQDDLWRIAKENVSTLEAIEQANGLEKLTTPWEKLLLIPKSV